MNGHVQINMTIVLLSYTAAQKAYMDEQIGQFDPDFVVDLTSEEGIPNGGTKYTYTVTAQKTISPEGKEIPNELPPPAEAPTGSDDEGVSPEA